jgi:hypothetical protein
MWLEKGHMPIILVPYDSRFEAVRASALPSVCTHCGRDAEGKALRCSFRYKKEHPLDPMSTTTEHVAVELPVCGECRKRRGQGINAIPRDASWVVLYGVSDRFADAMAQLLKQQANEFEQSLLQSHREDEPKDVANEAGFDWSNMR